MRKILRTILMVVVSLWQISCDRETALSAPEVTIVSCSVDSSGDLIVELEGRNCDKMFAVALAAETNEPTRGWVRFNGVEAKDCKVVIKDLIPGFTYMVYAVSIQDGDTVVFSNLAAMEYRIPELEEEKPGGEEPDGGNESGNDDGQEDAANIPFFADLDLLPGGSLSKEPKYWDENRFLPHVTYKETGGKEKWLHEAFLLIDGSINGKLLCIENGAESANQSDWSQFIEYWFGTDAAVAILDKTVGNAISRIGVPAFGKHKIVMAMPDPVMLQTFSDKRSSTTYWGKINGRQMDFRSVTDQILAYKWFIDQVCEAWDRIAPANLQLAGFYILSEILVARPDGYNYQYKRWDQILPSVSSYLHSMDYGMYWIPYYQADGYDMTSKLGIDYTWLQPNAYWDYPEKKQKKEWNWVFNTMKTYGHGMEIEFEGSHGEGGWSQYEDGVPRTSSSILETVRTNYEAEGRRPGEKNPYASRNRTLLREYMSNFKDNGYYGKARIATYSGTNAMYELATSSDENDRQMYLEYCRFIVNSPLRK